MSRQCAHRWVERCDAEAVESVERCDLGVNVRVDMARQPLPGGHPTRQFLPRVDVLVDMARQFS